MNKKEIKKQLRILMERFEDLRSDFDLLKEEIEETSSNIEPYENRYELTPQQEERQEWLDGVAYAMEDIINFDIEYLLEEYLED